MVGELESDVKSGNPISLFDFANAIEAESKDKNRHKPQKSADEKPSLLSKLEQMSDEEFDELEKFPDFNY